MQQQLRDLRIAPVCQTSHHGIQEESYCEQNQEKIYNTLKRMFPHCFIDEEPLIAPLQAALESLPFVLSVPPKEIPGSISFYTLAKKHPETFKCFYNWISNSLIPGKELQMTHLYSINFQLPELSPSVYTLCEITIEVNEGKELEMIERRFPLIQNQWGLGVAVRGHQRLQANVSGLAINHVMYPVFMPSNEEEIIRNILCLSNQLKYIRDIPQVMISFDRQTRHSLLFTIVLVRILHPESVTIQNMFKDADTYLEYIHDRTKNLGFLRNKYIKESVVFHVKIPKELFLRSDHSLDLFKARQAVLKELEHVIGEVRDFNGGMISQQTEILSALITLLHDSGDYPEFLIENFFYSLTPSIMRYLIEPDALKTLFLMLLQIEENELINSTACSIHTQQDKNYIFAAILIRDFSVKERINEKISALNPSSTALVSATMHLDHLPCLGFIYQCDDPLKQRLFCEAIREGCSDSNDPL